MITGLRAINVPRPMGGRITNPCEELPSPYGGISDNPGRDRKLVHGENPFVHQDRGRKISCSYRPDRATRGLDGAATGSSFAWLLVERRVGCFPFILTPRTAPAMDRAKYAARPTQP